MPHFFDPETTRVNRLGDMTADLFRREAAKMQDSKRERQRKAAAVIETALGLPLATKDALAKVTSDAQWNFLNGVGRKDARFKALQPPYKALARTKLEAKRLRE